MNGWFLAILLISAVELGIVAGKHGQPRKDTYSIGWTLTSYIIYIFLVYKSIQTGF